MDSTPSVEVLSLDDARRLAQLVGTLNESKQIKQVSYSTPRLVTFAGVPPKLVKQLDREAIKASRDALSQKYVSKMQDLFAKAKKIGKTAVDHDLRQLVHGTFQKARELGYQAMGRIVDLDKFDKTIISRAAEEELKYAKGFIDDYTAGKGRMPYDQRFAQYQNTVTHQFNMAAVQSVPADMLIWWEMTSMEPCADCPQLAAESPYTGDLGNNPLPTVPQAGDTQCCGNCRCYLRYEWTGFHIGTEPDMSYEVDAFEGDEVSADWLSTKTGRLVQQDLNNMYRREAYHRQMMDAHGHGTTEWRHHKELRDKWNSKLKAYKDQHGIRAVPRSNVSDYLAPVDDLLGKGFRVLVGPSEYQGEAALLRGLRLTPGEVKNVSKSSVRMKLINGKEKVFSYGDDAGSSLWVKQDMSAYVHPAYRQYAYVPGKGAEPIRTQVFDRYASAINQKGRATASQVFQDQKAIASVLDDLEKRFDIFKTTGKLDQLNLEYTTTKVGYTATYIDKKITLNLRSIRGAEKGEANYLLSNRIKYTASQGTIDGTTRHEVGHFLQERAIYIGNTSGNETNAIFKEIIDEYGEKGVQKMLSVYATTNTREFFAESWAIYSKPGYVAGTLPAKIENMVQTALRGKQAVTAAPEILSAAERATIGQRATSVAAEFKKTGWDANTALYGLKKPAELFDSRLSSVMDDVVKTPGSLVSSSEANRRLMARWSGSSQCDEALAMKKLSGVRTTYVKGVGYGDDDSKVLSLIKDKVTESTKSIATKYGMTEEQLQRVLSAQSEFTKQFLKEMGQETVTVYRGVREVYAGAQKLTRVVEVPEAIKVEVNSLSSWSLSRSNAWDFAGKDGYILKYKASLKDVFAAPMSTEKELILKTDGLIEVLVQSASKL